MFGHFKSSEDKYVIYTTWDQEDLLYQWFDL